MDIILTGDAFTDRTKIEYVMVAIHELLANYDTTKGIHIIFGDTAKYESFVEILDFAINKMG